MSSINPWDIYDYSNEKLQEVYHSITCGTAGMPCTASERQVLLEAMEREMKERSLSFSVVQRISSLSPTVSLVIADDGAADLTLADTGAPLGGLPSILARPPWYVDEIDVVPVAQSMQGTDGRLGNPAARYKTMWDEDDVVDLEVNADEAGGVRRKRTKGGRKQAPAAVMNKLGFFEVQVPKRNSLKRAVDGLVVDSFKSVAGRRSAPKLPSSRETVPPRTRNCPPAKTRLLVKPTECTTSSADLSSAPLATTEDPPGATMLTALVVPETSSSLSHDLGVFHMTSDCASTAYNTQASVLSRAAVEEETSKHQTAPGDQTTAAGKTNEGEQEATNTTNTLKMEAAKAPAPAEEVSSVETSRVVWLCGEADGPPPVLSLASASLGALQTAAVAGKGEGTPRAMSWMTEAEQSTTPILHRDREPLYMERMPRTSSNICTTNSLTNETAAEAVAAIVASKMPANKKARLAAVSEGYVPRPIATVTADYSSFFPTLAHLLIDPTHLFSFSTQPLHVALKAAEMLAASTRKWVEGVVSLAATSGAAGFSAEDVLAKRRLFKVQQDRTEVRELLCSVLTDSITEGESADASKAWIEVGGWVDLNEENHDVEDDDEEALWNRYLCTGSVSSSCTSGSAAAKKSRAADVWALWWLWGKPRPRADSVWLATQLVNHIPQSHHLTRKDLLKGHIQRHTKRKSGNSISSSGDTLQQRSGTPSPSVSATPSGSLAKPPFCGPPRRSLTPSPALCLSGPAAAVSSQRLPLTPLTYTLPQDYVEFASQFAAHGGTWILKTVGMSRGRGIRLVSAIDDIVYSETSVVQRYVDRPLLIDGGYKFDMRLYVLVTQFSPTLEAFVSSLGFFRIASRRYCSVTGPRASEPEHLYAHLTNTSISNASKKLSSGGEAAADLRLDCKWTLEEGREYLRRHFPGVSWDKQVWPAICETILRVLYAVQDAIPPQHQSSSSSAGIGIGPPPSTFELFGFDVLLDEHWTPWVLEVNASPSMEIEGPKDEAVKPALIRDIVNLLDPIPVDWSALLAVLTQHSPADLKRLLCGSARREVNAVLHAVLQARVPRRIGERPGILGSFEILAPSDRADAALKWKRSSC